MHFKTDKSKTILMLLIQLVIFVTTAITAVNGFFFGAGSNQDGDNMIGMGYFKAFTMDSNILAGICALFLICVLVRDLIVKEYAMPRWIAMFQYVSATCLLLTFVTVVFFLAPSDVMEGKTYFGMFADDLFVFHLTNPLLAVGSFVFLQDRCRFSRRDCIWSLIPLSIYAAVYFCMVVVLKKWRDFYGFTFGGRNYLIPLVVIVILTLTYLLAYLLIWLNNRFANR